MVEFTEKKMPANPAANQGRQIDEDLDATVENFVHVGHAVQEMAGTFQIAVRRMAADEPLTTLAFVAGTGFVAGAIWKSLR